MPKCASDTRPGAIGFNVCPDWFWFCFGLISPFYALIPSFWNVNVHLSHHYMLEIYNLRFDFYRGSQLRVCLEVSEETLDLDF